jgi:ABC-type glycerol-3-phosphate transport system substrate-binding protein
MPKGYKNAELAWKVISFVNGDEGQRIIMSKKQKPWIGFVSTKKFADEQAKELAPIVENVEWIPKSSDWVSWYPRTVKWLETRDKIINPGIDLILRGKVGAAEQLKKIDDDANKLLTS